MVSKWFLVRVLVTTGDLTSSQPIHHLQAREDAFISVSSVLMSFGGF